MCVREPLESGAGSCCALPPWTGRERESRTREECTPGTADKAVQTEEAVERPEEKQQQSPSPPPSLGKGRPRRRSICLLVPGEAHPLALVRRCLAASFALLWGRMCSVQALQGWGRLSCLPWGRRSRPRLSGKGGSPLPQCAEAVRDCCLLLEQVPAWARRPCPPRQAGAKTNGDWSSAAAVAEPRLHGSGTRLLPHLLLRGSATCPEKELSCCSLLAVPRAPSCVHHRRDHLREGAGGSEAALSTALGT
ncbi:uncharacterized protein ACIB01_015413 [Guaruba guarouba]